MKFNKTTMSLALTAAMFGSVAMTQQAFAVPDLGGLRDAVNDVALAGDSDVVANAIGSLTPEKIKDLTARTIAHGTYVSINGLGQALIYPYYTVRGGFRTTINVFNSSDRAVAVKVRFREFQNSRDVLDFNLVLSPNDKWYGVVKEDGTNGAVLTTNDTSCTVPKIQGSSAPFSKAGYADPLFVDSGDQGLERLKSGYVEIIPMAWSTEGAIDAVNADGSPQNVAAAALHKQPSGIPRDCNFVVSAFTPKASWSVGGARVVGAGNPDIGDGDEGIEQIDGGAGVANPAWEAIPKGVNPLFGEYGIFNAEGGVAGGSNAVALADWMAGKTLLTAQQFPYYLEPTLATANGIWDTTLLAETDLALTSSEVLNEWANNDTNGAHTDWVLTMPTKSFHVDQDEYPAGDLNGDGDALDYNIQAGSSYYRYNQTGAGSPTLLEPFASPFANGKADINISFNDTMFNNEEGHPGGAGSVSFSPGTSFGTPVLRYEANVINFGGGQVLSAGKMANDDTVALVLDPVNDIAEGRKHGFLKLQINDGSTAVAVNIGDAANTTLTTTVKGLPMVGFAVKERNQGDASKSYGQLFDHKWKDDTTTVVTP